jgi:hypothetical protein
LLPSPSIASKTSRRGILLAAGGLLVPHTLLPGAALAQQTPSALGVTVDYSARDYEIVDYRFYEDPSLPGVKLRGPRFDPAAAEDFFTCIGAAQTLGVFVERPYPTLLSERLGLPAWNVGLGGANARFFLDHPRIIELANRGRFVILQVMAARSEHNDRISPTAGAELVRDEKRGDVVVTNTAWDRIKTEEPENLQRYISQSRAAWRDNYRRLLDRLTVPVLLFWFSPKPMDASIDTAASSGFGLLDRFPQFVEGTDIEAVRPMAEGFAACLSDRNTGHPLISRFTGKPVQIGSMRTEKRFLSHGEASRNIYYPSPEMHEDAADLLEASVAKLTPSR